MRSLGLIGMLSICSIQDLKEKQISIWPILIFGVLGEIMNLVDGKINVKEGLMCFGVGIILYLYSVLSEEKIGKGDAAVMGITGVYAGFWAALGVLWIASIMALAVGLIVLKVKKETLKYELPFIPFILVGYITMLLNTALQGGAL